MVACYPFFLTIHISPFNKCMWNIYYVLFIFQKICALHVLEDINKSKSCNVHKEFTVFFRERRHILKNGNDQRQITFNNKYIPSYSTFFLAIFRDSLGSNVVSGFMNSIHQGESTSIHFQSNLLFTIFACQFIEMETRMYKAHSWNHQFLVSSVAWAMCREFQKNQSERCGVSTLESTLKARFWLSLIQQAAADTESFQTGPKLEN